MSVVESVVQPLEIAGILSFAEGGILDETPAESDHRQQFGVTEVPRLNCSSKRDCQETLIIHSFVLQKKSDLSK